MINYSIVYILSQNVVALLNNSILGNMRCVIIHAFKNHPVTGRSEQIAGEEWGRDRRRRLPETVVNKLAVHMAELPALGWRHKRGRGRSTSPRRDWGRSWMLLEHMELWVRRFKQKKDRDSLSFSSSGMPGWLCCCSLHFPNDSILNGRKNSGHSLGLALPGSGWQG